MSNYDEFLSSVDDVDQSAVEEYSNRYPVIQWVKGDQRSKKIGGFAYHGGWFIAEKNADMTGVEGWENTEWVRENGEEIEGFYAPVLEFSVVNHREWWELQDDKGMKQRFDWNSYRKAAEIGKPKGRNQYLVVVKGIEERGMFLLSLSGTAGMAFDNQKGALSKLTKCVVSKANEFLKSKKDTRKMPFYSFWLKVGYNRDEKGNPLFVEVGKGKDTSMVCLPMAWDFPTGDEKVEFLDFYVGKGLNADIGQMFKESVEWANQAAKIISGSFDKPDAEPSQPKTQEGDKLAEMAAEYGV